MLFEHPFAGIQIPAGTVEPGETPEQAVRREVGEEIGLTSLASIRYLGSTTRVLPEGQRLVCQCSKVVARPDPASFDWASLRSGICVTVERTEQGYSQVTYQEPDREPSARYVTMQITGWVPDAVLAAKEVRHFFLCPLGNDTPDHWTVLADNHLFSPFWAPLAGLPQVVAPQDQWLAILQEGLSLVAEADSGLHPKAGEGPDRPMALVIRPYLEPDQPDVTQLWREVFPSAPSWNEPESDILRKLAVQRELFLVATLGRTLVGTAMAGYDGHRGWVYYLAVGTGYRRQGIGTKLMSAVESRLSRLGCLKLNLQVRGTNHEVVAFYKQLGYEVEDRISMGKRLVSD